MNQRSLLYFLTTAEERNMTQAAKKLFISQQTLSSAIQRLEKEYHTQFFLRGPHLQLTDAGHCMVTYAREMLARTKDFLYAIAKPKPTYLGEAIPVSGNGDATNDKN